MKKQLLLAMAFVAGIFTANAQGTYSVGEQFLDAGGNLPAVTTITNVELGSITSVPGVTLTFGANTYTMKKHNNPFNEVFTARLEGGSNPAVADGTGCFYKFEVSEDGELDLTYQLGAAKKMYVLDNGTDLTENAMPDFPYEVVEKVTEGKTIKVQAGHTYYLFGAGTKLGFYGFTFRKAGGGTGISSAEADKQVVATEYYNVLGMKLNEPTKGLNIIKKIMDDGSSETTKAYME